MNRVLVAALLLLSLPARLSCQSTSPALLRIVRLQPGEAVCSLVREDGTYRLEKTFRAKTEMYTGAVDSTRLNQLHSLLSNPRLKSVSQEEIHKVLIADTLDALQIIIRRDASWQDLTFMSAESRKPFKESIDPLLRWFQDLQKQHSEHTGGNPTQCALAKSDSLAAVAPEPGAQMVNAPEDYLFQVTSSHGFQWKVESTCTVVFADGSFHRERSEQYYMANRHYRIADGHVDLAALQSLRNILNSPGLKEAISDVANEERPRTEDTSTTLIIPRREKIQRLTFSSSFNTIGNPREVGGMSNMTYHVAKLKAVEPLMTWMKENTDKNPSATEKDAVGNDCYPAITTIKTEASN